MIDIEAAQDGFALFVEGRKVLAHSRRAPCVEIGVAETAVRQHRGSVRLHRRRAVSIPIRSYKVFANEGEFCALDFDGKIRMALRLEGARLRMSFSLYDASINFFRIRLAAFHDESIFGLGERFSHLDLKGRRVRLWVEERGSGRGAADHAGSRRVDHDSSCFPSPVFISTRKYWCAVDTNAHTIMDFSRRASTLIEAWAVPREIVLGIGTKAQAPQAEPGARGQGEAPELVGDMSSYLGRQVIPPSWVYDGAIIGVQGGMGVLQERAEACLASGSKIAGFLIGDWCGRAHPGGAGSGSDWTWDRELYPDLPRQIALLRSRGIRVLGSLSPMLRVDGEQYAEAARSLWCVKEGGRKDYTVTCSGSPHAMVDLSNPAAFAWLKELIKRELLGIGMSGWVADSGEALPPDAVLSSGEEAVLAHNRWPVLWARANREAIEDSGRLGDAIFFSRGGWLGSTRYAMAFWVGDRAPVKERKAGFASTIPAAISAGLSGAGFWQFDIGGAEQPARGKGSPTGLLRRMEMAAFTPFFRAEDFSGAGPAPWNDPSSMAMLSRMTEVFASLKPYHMAAAAEYAEQGLPPIRHPWLHYEGDSEVLGLSLQYMYGRDLMIAPSMGACEELTSLYLPEDTWVHLWSSREFRGGGVTVESPPGYPAVFYRSESRFASLFDAIRRTAKRL